MRQRSTEQPAPLVQSSDDVPSDDVASRARSARSALSLRAARSASCRYRWTSISCKPLSVLANVSAFQSSWTRSKLISDCRSEATDDSACSSSKRARLHSSSLCVPRNRKTLTFYLSLWSSATILCCSACSAAVTLPTDNPDWAICRRADMVA